jgi:hypothetical protein
MRVAVALSAVLLAACARTEPRSVAPAGDVVHECSPDAGGEYLSRDEECCLLAATTIEEKRRCFMTSRDRR